MDVEDLTAGCVSIAVAQILAYNKYPDFQTVIGGDGSEDWDWLLTDHSSTKPEEGSDEEKQQQENVVKQTDYYAQLVHEVGVGCDMNYGFFGGTSSFATPAAAKRYLESLGYNNVQQYNSYSGVELDVVLEQLRKHLPVFIGAISGVIDGHAWVIDGYRTEYQIKIGTNSSGDVVSTTSEPLRYYVHCNWGWVDAKNDGWFSYGLFDISEAYLYDNDNQRTDELDFDHLFRVITYDKP